MPSLAVLAGSESSSESFPSAVAEVSEIVYASSQRNDGVALLQRKEVQ